jgi:hypothetical protein
VGVVLIAAEVVPIVVEAVQVDVFVVDVRVVVADPILDKDAVICSQRQSTGASNSETWKKNKRSEMQL